GRWDPDRGSFRGWLRTITRNLLINLLARQRRQPRGSGDSEMQEFLAAQPEPDPEASGLFDAEYGRRLFEWGAGGARGEFTLKTWEAFRRTAVDGRRPGDVATELGMSVGAVYIARSRVLARLRQRIEQLDGDAARRLGGDGDGGSRESL